ncbi:hypothetical protein RRG08_040519 [Elysia crispata]|uniref:Uncharacterized protein n=1 Tax=Elysia crispata TaxID=231223 RepID=A0AAE1D9U8_9GAST|nr:hypothetical protein RRG08_040519 [Elysia crispata]
MIMSVVSLYPPLLYRITVLKLKRTYTPDRVSALAGPGSTTPPGRVLIGSDSHVLHNEPVLDWPDDKRCVKLVCIF